MHSEIKLKLMSRFFILASISLVSVALSFIVIPIFQIHVHVYQTGIFMIGFLFGPLYGALAGAVISSYNALFVLHNPWVIGGNALLGLSAAFLYKRMRPLEAVLAAYALQLPYLFVTDVYFAGMPISAVGLVSIALLASNLLSGMVAWKITNAIANEIKR